MSQDVPSDHDPAAQPTDAGGGEVDWGLQFEPGSVLGDRYQIRALLGCGGKGEVWHAYDLKLRVEVALKGLRPELLADGSRRESLRPEVRAAREVVSPNVCRIFDLIEADGSELVSMEYVDGGTLLEVLQERGPLDLKEAQDIASQFLAGLEAIHKAGLVHRDVKPENIMLTRAGRVVLMDFGLARQEDSGASTVSGTPAYMAPEQAMGGKVDARADVYSAGVVLAEMVSPDGIKNLQSRQSVWEGIRHEPARVPDSPWAPVLKKAVAKEPDQRYNSAHTLTRALEDVTLRVEGAEDLTPYPGLASFTEEDAEFFFGREAEIEQIWRKLEGAHLLAIVGPSGAGKTSFIAAGLVPNAPSGWAIVRCTPGNAATTSLRQALVSEIGGDSDAIRELVEVENPDAMVSAISRWRSRIDQALLVVDQFEELFTQNTADEQRCFAELLGRLPLDADIHVLLSMRDDFLMHCNKHEALKPVFSELTPLGPPVGPALRRALVQPAMKCGYRFEDDALVEKMLAEVDGERGALPLLAFAMSRLWEKRDRDNGLLTRQAYHDIGGVGGSLARHAEATLESIGVERQLIVRELFRNLVTADGTRAVREWDELLSVFEESKRESAEEVLRDLIDARLLTSYEIQEEGQEPTRRVEIIHESLLANWPRLVRWQTQDEEGAQLRDELRHAARSWDEHGRQDDRLWTGTAFREFQLWSERYPGGLTKTEDAFTHAMTVLAGRRRRNRRFATAVALIVLAGVASVLGLMWSKSERETRRAEAQKLIALGQLELDGYPTAALSFATASLDLADTWGARRLAMKALWKGPTAFVVNEDLTFHATFSPDGRWLVQEIDRDIDRLRVIRADGGNTLLEHVSGGQRAGFNISPESDYIYAVERRAPLNIGLWSAPDGRRHVESRYNQISQYFRLSWGNLRVLVGVLEDGKARIDALNFDGTRERLGTLDFTLPSESDWHWGTAMNYRTGRWFGAVVDNEVLVVEIKEHALSVPRSLGRHEGLGMRARFDPAGRYLATANGEGTIRLWDPSGVQQTRALHGPPGLTNLRISNDGAFLDATVWPFGRAEIWSLSDSDPRLLRRLDFGQHGGGSWSFDAVGMQVADSWNQDHKIRLWPLSAPADAEGQVLGRGKAGAPFGCSFHPEGHWLVSTGHGGLVLWPLARSYAAVIRRHDLGVQALAFDPQGRWLASGSSDAMIKLWPLDGHVPSPGRVLFDEKEEAGSVYGLAVSPDGGRIVVSTHRGGVQLLSPQGESRQTLPGNKWGVGVAFSADGQLAAAHSGTSIRTWDVASGKVAAVATSEKEAAVDSIWFTPDGDLLSSSGSGLIRWDLGTGESELLYVGSVSRFAASADGRQVLVVDCGDRRPPEFNTPGRAVLLDLETGATSHLVTHGDRILIVALDPSGTVAVTADVDGVVRVGPVTGEEPHVLHGHEGSVRALAIDPLGRWIASAGGEDGAIRLWPMPDLSKPPLHTLPRAELIAKLKTLTNLRVVRHEDSPTGWTLTHDPFPGWETVPTW